MVKAEFYQKNGNTETPDIGEVGYVFRKGAQQPQNDTD